MGFMMLKRVKILFVLMAILLGGSCMNARECQYEQYVNEIVRSFAEEMKKEFDLNCTGDGGRMSKDVEEIEIIFKTNRQATIVEARELEVLITEKFVKAINAHEKIKPFLREFPFPASRAIVSISFDPLNNMQYPDGNVSHVFQGRGDIVYYAATDPFVGYSNRRPLIEEPYDEALKIVKSLPLKNPLVHEAKEHDVLIERLYSDFAKEMRKEQKLQFCYLGGTMPNKIEEFSVKFNAYKKSTIEQARKMEVIAVERLLKMINENEKLKPYLIEYPFTASRIKMRISFVDKHNYSYDEGLEQVDVIGNEICYFNTVPFDYKTYREKGALSFPLKPPLLAKEPYEKARGIVEGKSSKSFF